MQYFLKIIVCSLFTYCASFHHLAYAWQVDESPTQIPANEPNDESGDIRYVSDELFTYLRAGPSANYRLIGSVTAGTQVQVLQIDEQAGYMEIIDPRQRTGWIETKFVSQEVSIRQQLQSLNSFVEQRNIEYSEMQNQVANMRNKLTEVTQQNKDLNRQVTQQLEEISTLKENIEQRERGNNMQWFTRGAIVSLVALVIGYVLGMFGRKRNRNSRLM